MKKLLLAMALSGCIEHVPVTNDTCENDPQGCEIIVRNIGDDMRAQVSENLDSGVTQEYPMMDAITTADASMEPMLDESLADSQTIENQDVPVIEDIDNDGIVDNQDNCISIANADQIDANNNGVGDDCELDITDIDASCIWVDGVCMQSCHDASFEQIGNYNYKKQLDPNAYQQGEDFMVGCFDICSSQAGPREALFIKRFDLISENKPNIRWFQNTEEFFPTVDSDIIEFSENECKRYTAIARNSFGPYVTSDEFIQGSESFGISVYFLDRRSAGLAHISLSEPSNSVYYRTVFIDTPASRQDYNSYAGVNVHTKFNTESDGKIFFSGSCAQDTRISKFPVIESLEYIFIQANAKFEILLDKLEPTSIYSLHFSLAGQNPELSYGPANCRVNISQVDETGNTIPGNFRQDDRSESFENLSLELPDSE